MKPPPRQRKKPNCRPEPAAASGSSGKEPRKWTRTEKEKLLSALKKLCPAGGGGGDFDISRLMSAVPSRSLAEIQQLIESAKTKVISSAEAKLRSTVRREMTAGKPIEAWTSLAAAITGSLGEVITSAFSQTLIVSSTEPSTVRKFEPAHVPARDVARDPVAPLQVMPGLQVPARHRAPLACPLPVLRTPATILGPARGPPAPSPVIHVLTAATLSSQPAETPALPSVQSRVTQLPPATALGSTQPQSPLPSSTVSSSDSTAPSCSKQSLVSGPTLPVHTATSNPSTATISGASVGPANRSTQEHSARTPDIKAEVDFEKIYCYLSSVHKPDNDCHLSAMEGAIVLDLLMSLPEELPHLDCNKLHKHLTRTFWTLLAPCDSLQAREYFSDLKKQTLSDDDPMPPTESEEGVSAAAKTPERVNGPVSQSESNKKSNSQWESDLGHCPPLNPFMIPLELLTRR